MKRRRDGRGAWHVLDDHRWVAAEVTADMGGEQSSVGIEPTAGWGADDNRDDFTFIETLGRGLITGTVAQQSQSANGLNRDDAFFH
jgi:hypothetical protein